MSAPFDDTAAPDYAGLLRLDGRGFVVLGAGQGIGRQVALALGQLGGEVLCVDRDIEHAQRVAGQVGGVAVAADVTQRGELERVFAHAAERLSRPYGVVDIVGMAAIQRLLDTGDDTYEQQHALVFRHVFLALQLGGRMLAARGEGAMVVVGSLSGLTAVEGQALYGAFKAGVHHLVRGAAAEFGASGVRVNTVAPGATKTPRLVATLGPDWRRVSDALPLRRVADPHEIASVIAFLCSDMAVHMTGQTLAVDGGASVASSRPPLIPTFTPSNLKWP
ncbi:SDR family NAD(P)-dependent oxidoreductase [Hydrogenophaga sp. BPS33]|uniref:SDR family NAD(P)-dependent oxidoreductase n=1 Tax=Hydrogenophaga sp. BPS33 TaxID=2651974 RepID=UPI00131F91DB|nr:SDR family oxidoreductase [Hydrogenophaga sp. BPS33]QHE85514.1 SDR family oxidoreductase [Hydrogenophaga sp. BPS33]